MKLAVYDEGRLGVVRDGMIFDVTSVLDLLPAPRYATRRGDPLVTSLPTLRPHIEALASRSEGVPLNAVSLQAPVALPGKLIGAPVNYQAHQAEAVADPATFTEAQVRRVHEIGLFLKANSSLVGPAQGIQIGMPDRRTDHEVELAVVIGRHARHVSASSALDYVAGYAIGLDMTVRGPEERSLRKSLDSYSVLGPYLVTADEIGDPGSLDLTLSVNGVQRQRANTRDLLVDVPGLIAMASAWYTLEPGDIIYTGTPAGVGPVEPGDEIVAEIESIGSMSIKVGKG